MSPRREIKGVLAALLLAVATHACAPKHTPGPGAADAPTRSRIPATSNQDHGGGGLQDAFLRDPPSCVVLLPAEATDPGALNPRLVEAAVERFLAVRFDRLIAGARRDRIARHLALDLRHPGDLVVLAKQTNCRHALSSKIGGGGLAYAVVWAERRVSLSLSLRRIDGDGETLWSAKADGARAMVACRFPRWAWRALCLGLVGWRRTRIRRDRCLMTYCGA